MKNEVCHELEDKWSINRIPENAELVAIMHQSYLIINELQEVRIRRKIMANGEPDVYKLGIKMKNHKEINAASRLVELPLNRFEKEVEISSTDYFDLLATVNGDYLCKNYYKLKLSSIHAVEMSEVYYKGTHLLSYAEVEYKDSDDYSKHSDIIDNWMHDNFEKSDKVTNDPYYEIKNVWKNREALAADIELLDLGNEMSANEFDIFMESESVTNSVDVDPKNPPIPKL